MTTVELNAAPMPREHRWWLGIIVLAVIYGLSVNNYWAVSPDAGLYLSLGRSLAEGRGMEYNGVQWWSIPPVLPFLIGGCRLLTGDDLWLVNVVLRLAAITTIMLGAMTVRRVGARHLSLGVLLVAGSSAYLYLIATRVQTDVIFAGLAAAGLYGFARGLTGSALWILLGGGALLVATMTRLHGVLFLVGAVAAMLLTWREPRFRWRLAATAIVVVLALAVFFFWSTRVRTLVDPAGADYFTTLKARWLTMLDTTHRDQMLDGLANFPRATFSAIMGQQPRWGIAAAPAIVIVLGLVSMARRREWIIVLPTVFYVGFFLFWGGSAVARRYFLPAMPFMVYALLVGTETIAGWVHRLRNRRREAAAPATGWVGRTAVIVVVAICMATSIPKVIREIWWMRQPDFYSIYDHGRWKDWVALGEYLGKHGRPGIDRVVSPECGVVGYYSRLRVLTPGVWSGTEDWATMSIRPREYAEAINLTGYRYGVVPLNMSEWSVAAKEEMAATAGYPILPKVCGSLAVYDRLEFDEDTGAAGPQPGDKM